MNKTSIHNLSGSLAIRYSEFSDFRPSFGQAWPQKPSRTTGLVLQCWLYPYWTKVRPRTRSCTTYNGEKPRHLGSEIALVPSLGHGYTHCKVVYS